ncbi:AraC family transcriptional regulator [Niastella caeni]|uniref:AraC family transcriptional regulator n=1 Tax=Niastella caeni TaxID=2569763 RepID=A0A4S8HY01_9BACT|nr:helix-turn-helix domain-containing protein [Niastella caeni]THU38112.1 AraC family transcriptional regulator [Niastella caeni]
MYKTTFPIPPLHKYVSCFWEGELVINANQVHTHHAIANSKVELLFCYAGNYVTTGVNGQPVKMPKASFYGQTTTSKQYISTARQNGFFGVRLYAHALPLLFSIPATMLTNQHIDIASLLNKQGAELSERIFLAPSFEERVQIAADFLLSRLQKKPAKLEHLEKRILSVYHSAQHLSICELANQANFSQRQFERHFKNLTGFSPKTYLKISRFESLASALSCQEGITSQKLTDMALDFGYYDQAHLNRHFKEFTGLSPSGYLKRQEVQNQ